MKYDYKKQEKEIYRVKDTPTIIDLNTQKYICIDSVGNPNSEGFSKNIKCLYSVAYTIKMKFKDIKDYFNYTVYPLEGYWGLTEKGIKIQNENGKLDKDELKYTLMIKQPSFVTKDLFNKAKELAIKTKKNELLNNVYYKEDAEGLCLQMLHIGSYDNEPSSFKIMEDCLKEKGYKRKEHNHKEIYLSDARKTEKEKLMTILRIKISKC